MSRKQLLLIGFTVLLLGALLSHSFYRLLQYRTAGPIRSGIDVIVAANDLQVGGRVTDEDIKIAKFQTSDVPPHCFHDKTMIVGRPLILPIARGDPVLPSDLGRSGDPLEFMGTSMRAVSIRTSGVMGVANSVHAGTRVDVLLTSTSHRGSKQPSTNVLKDVTVIATGQNLVRDSHGDVKIFPTVTLPLTADDAQKLASASLKGRGRFLLRTR